MARDIEQTTVNLTLPDRPIDPPLEPVLNVGSSSLANQIQKSDDSPEEKSDESPEGIDTEADEDVTDRALATSAIFDALRLAGLVKLRTGPALLDSTRSNFSVLQAVLAAYADSMRRGLSAEQIVQDPAIAGLAAPTTSASHVDAQVGDTDPHILSSVDNGNALSSASINALTGIQDAHTLNGDATAAVLSGVAEQMSLNAASAMQSLDDAAIPPLDSQLATQTLALDPGWVFPPGSFDYLPSDLDAPPPELPPMDFTAMAEQFAAGLASYDNSIEHLEGIGLFFYDYLVVGLRDKLQASDNTPVGIALALRNTYVESIDYLRGRIATAGDTLQKFYWFMAYRVVNYVWQPFVDELVTGGQLLGRISGTTAANLRFFNGRLKLALRGVGLIDDLMSGDQARVVEASTKIALIAAALYVVGPKVFGPALVAGFSLLWAPATAEIVAAAIGPELASLAAYHLGHSNGQEVNKVVKLLQETIGEDLFRLDGLFYGEGSAVMDLQSAGLVYQVLIHIDPTFGQHSESVFDFSANSFQQRESVAVLNSLSRVFTPSLAPLADSAISTVIATDAEIISRGSAIASVFDGLGLNGLVKLRTGVPITDRRAGFSVFLGLQAGSQIIVSAADPQDQALVDAKLGSLFSDTYQLWQDDLAAIAAHADPLTLNFTDSYLNDRSAMIAVFRMANSAETDRVTKLSVLNGISGIAGQSLSVPTVYTDVTTNTVVQWGSNGLLADALNFTERKIKFGDKADNFLGGLGGDDHLYGGDGNDTLQGLAGDDWLEGNDGDDSLIGGAGNDTVLGGAGNDTLDGGDGNDLLYGGSGDDKLDGGANNDTLYGGSGENELRGGAGNDSLVGGAGFDKLFGEADADTLDGGAGDDWLTGGAGDDLLKGGDGYDSYFLAKGDGDDTIDDSDGQGDILIDGLGLSGGKMIEPGLWQDSNGVLYIFSPDATGHGDLFIVSKAGQTVVKNFANGNLGITLQGIPTLGTVPVTFAQVTGSAGDDNSLANAALVSPGPATWIRGLGGRDEIFGGANNDLLEGGSGNDIVYGRGGDDLIFGGDRIDSSAITAYIQSTAHTPDFTHAPTTPQLAKDGEWLNGGAGNDAVVGSATNDVLLGGGGSDVLIGGAGHDVIDGDRDFQVANLTTTDIRRRVGGDPVAVSFSPVNLPNTGDQTPGSGDETGGNDMIFAGSGDDIVVGGMGADVIFGDDGNDSLAGDRSEYRIATFGNDYIDGGIGNDLIFGDAGADTLIGGDGNDSLYGNNNLIDAQTNTNPTEPDDGDDLLSGGKGNDWLAGGSGSDNLYGGDGNDTLLGDLDYTAEQVSADRLGNDYLDGGTGDDHIEGFGGNDTLLGGNGNDTMFGGDGDDYLDGGFSDFHGFVGEVDDVLFGGDGNDTLISTGSYSFLQGDAGNDSLLATFGNNTLLGGAGNDTLGSDGDGSNVLFGGDDDDVLISTGGSNLMSGDAGDDQLYGGSAYDTLFGGTGKDLLVGGLYQHGGADDDVLLGGTVSNVLSGDDGNDQADGQGGNDTVFGGSGNDTLAGGSGINVLMGGADNDTYLFDGEGTDLIFDTEGTNVVEIGGGITVDQVNFRQGIDDSGNNRYLVISTGDGTSRLIIAGGLDSSIASFHFVEGNLTLSAAEAIGRIPHLIGGTGSASGSAALSTSSLDTSEPGTAQAAADSGSTMQSAYYFALPSMQLQGTADADVFQLPFAGSVSSLDGNDTLQGSTANDTLDGGAGDDSLSGGRGDDVLTGGTGQDTYVFGLGEGSDSINETSDSSAQPVSELDTLVLGAGIAQGDVRLLRDGQDMVVVLKNSSTQARINGYFNETTLVLVNGQFQQQFIDRKIEKITFTNGDFWNAAAIASRIEAGAVDTLVGSAANDSYTVDNAADVVSEQPGAGDDTVSSSVTYALPNNVEHLVLTGTSNLNAWGNAGNAVSYLTGNDGNNIFNGAGGFYGADGTLHYAISGGITTSYSVMTGGKGDDTYYLDYQKGGQVIENADEGNDTVWVTNAFLNVYTLPDNVENLFAVAQGSTWSSATRFYTGNASNNYINGLQAGVGSPISNVIDGGAGADTMVGFSGSDVFYVDNLGDVVIEKGVFGNGQQAGPGDEVRSSVNFELGDNLEWLTLRGSAAIDGWGNLLANRLDGSQNSASNKLYGGWGDDWYIIGANDIVIEQADQGTDIVQFSGTGTRTYTSDELDAFDNVEGLALGDNLYASSIEGDSRHDRLFGNTSGNSISGGLGDDYIVGGLGNDTLIGDEGDDTIYGGLDPVTGYSLYNPYYDTVNGIFYTDGANVIDGGAGDDLLIGGNGNGTSSNTFNFSSGFGQDTIGYGSRGSIHFDSTINSSAVYFEDGLLKLRGSSDSIRLATNASGYPSVSYDGDIRFADGSSINASDLNFLLSASFSHQPSNSADLLYGSDSLDDNISGLGGNDVIYGLGGNDTLSGDDGDDRVNGDAGDDSILGGAGADLLHGGDGNDTLDGGSGNDTLYADAGNDVLLGGDGADILNVGDGADLLDGGNGDDQLYGGTGYSTLRGGAGNDFLAGGGHSVLDGGAGSDNLFGSAGTTYVFRSGNGQDAVVQGFGAMTWQVDAGLNPADVHLVGSSVLQLGRSVPTYTLVLSANGGADKLTWSIDTATPDFYLSAIEIHFANDVIWNAATEVNQHGDDTNHPPTGVVTVSGVTVQNQVLTAANTLADADGLGALAYQWQSSINGTNWTAISGATANSFALTEAQVGKLVRVTASYVDGHGTAESVASAATTAIANVNDAPTGNVTLSGTATQNQTLTAANTLADADGLGSIAYQWQSSSDGSAWNAISGATSGTFTLGEAQVGKLVRVTASYADGHGTPESVASAPTATVANVNDAPTGSVTVSGTAAQNQTLTAANTLADADGLGSIAYQWQSSTDGSAWNAIAGATAGSFTLGEAQVGKFMRVAASYIDGHGTSESVASIASTPVTNVNDAPTGTVIVTGTATQNEVLTASNTLADADGLGTIAYQWQSSIDGSTWSSIVGATSNSFTLSEAQVSRQIRVAASYIDGHGTAESVASAATTPVTNVNDAPTGTVLISGTPSRNEVLSASNSLADADGVGTIDYQWQSSIDGNSWNAIAGATSSSFMLNDAQVGQLVRVTASYLDGHGTAESVASAATAAVTDVNNPPTGAVLLSGTAAQNEILSATNTLADADGLGTIGYQWQSSIDGNSWNAIAGATGSTFALSEAQVGQSVRVKASYIDGHGTAESVASLATAAIVNVNDTPTGSVTVSGTAVQNQILTASNTLADADGLGAIGYQWQSSADGSSWVAISGANANTFALTEAQVGQFVRVTASYLDGHGTAESVASVATATVATVNDAPTGSVTINGTVTQNQTLTAENTLADADGMGTVAYQWQSSVDGSAWNAIGGATASTFTLSEAQVGEHMRVMASYIDGHGTAESVASAASAPVANVNDALTGTVVISGTASQNDVLTASNTLADLDGLGTISYQWQSSIDGNTWGAIAGATANILTLVESQVGQQIRVTASYTDGHGTAESVASAATTPVANINDAPTGTVLISGTVSQNQVLTASNTLADADGLGTIGYQWQSSADGSTWNAIADATSSTFMLGEAQVGQEIRVTASYIDGHGTAESLASAATAAVTNANNPPSGEVILSGTAAQNQILTVSNTLADADGLGTIGYQWQFSADGNTWNAIAGATAETFTLSEAQVGNRVRVTASYIDGHGIAESVASAATASVANVNDVPTGTVIVNGSATQNQILTASNSLADADGLGTMAYQWQSSSDGSTWTAIDGATSGTFALTEAQVDKVVRVTASYLDGHGTVESVASVATTPIANINDAPTGSVAIGGTAAQNQVLTASNTLADLDGLGAIAYQWQSSIDGSTWNAIDGATTSSFMLAAAQVGEHMRVLASYVDGHGTPESVASAATAAVLSDDSTGNHPPTVAHPIIAQATLEDSAFAFTVPTDTFSDPDPGDVLTLFATLADGSALPTWLSFDAATQTFSGLPANGDVGTLNLKLTATDQAGASVATGFDLSVINTNDAPIYVGRLQSQLIPVGQPYSYTIAANTFVDPDIGDVLAYSASLSNGSALPNWLHFDAATQSFSGTPPTGFSSVVKLTATDGSGASASGLFKLLAMNMGPTTDSINTDDAQETDLIAGSIGNDSSSGLASGDAFTDSSGSALFYGTANSDTLTGDARSELYVGGLGNDTLRTGAGNDVILFNTGDGRDTLAADGSSRKTLSLGGDFSYDDLALSNTGDDLVLKIGFGDEIDFKDWYAATPSRPVVNLQVIAKAMAGFNAGGPDPMLDQKVENFNFAGVVGTFDAARTANPALTTWALTNALANFQLAGSDSAALGGDLAYQYGKNGTLAGIGLTSAQEVIGNPNFGSQAQTLHPLAGLQTGAVRLG